MNRLNFSLDVEPPLIVLGYQFGENRPWESVPYAWPLSDGSRPSRVLPPARVVPGTRALLWISLVSVEDGVIHAQRGIPLAPDFTGLLNGLIRAQAKLPLDGDAYVQAIARVFDSREHPRMFEEPSIASTTTDD